MKSVARIALISGAIAISVGAAEARTLVQSFLTSSAVSDDYHNGSSDHSAWLPNAPYGSDYNFAPSGKFSIYDDGFATLQGTIESQSNPEARFTVSVNFQSTDDGTPKEELISSAYAPDGPVDPSTWSFFNLTSGSLIGSGLNAFTSYSLAEAPESGAHPFQIGIGANGKNIQLGGSGWFFYTPLFQCEGPCEAALAPTYQGDFNLTFANDPDFGPSPVPLPAGGLLLIGAFGALAAVGRRKTKKA